MSAGASNPATSDDPSSTVSVYKNSFYVNEKNQCMLWSAVKPSKCDGFIHSLGWGGTIIDFDYLCPVNTSSTHTSICPVTTYINMH